MENQDYQIDKVYLSGGSVEQTDYMAQMGDNPENNRKRDIATYQRSFDYCMKTIDSADFAKAEVINTAKTTGEDSLETNKKIRLINEREAKARFSLAVDCAALNFYRNEKTAHGFAGLTIYLKNGNAILINSGFYDNYLDCVSQYNTETMQSVPFKDKSTNMKQVLAELSKVNTAVSHLSINTKSGSGYHETNSDIPYLQPSELAQVMEMEKKTENVGSDVAVEDGAREK